MNTEKQRENVVRGLKCRHRNPVGEDCTNCQYGVRFARRWGCDFGRLCGDALALLKEQEARVVKISELTSGEPMLVWLEDIDKEETVAGMIFDYVPGRFGFKLTDIGSMDRIYPRIEDYLTRWRCWTARPTAEQREAVKWH